MHKDRREALAAILALGQLFNHSRFSLEEEKKTQGEIADCLKQNHVPYEREKRLSEKDIPDFLIDRCVVVEIKLKGSVRSIYEQCKRYCIFPEVKALLLVTNKSMALPAEINGKPCFVLNISQAWL